MAAAPMIKQQIAKYFNLARLTNNIGILNSSLNTSDLSSSIATYLTKEETLDYLIEEGLNKIIPSFILPKDYKSDDDLFSSSIFTQKASRRLSYAALLRIRNSLYHGFALKRLAYESLQLVQNSDNKLAPQD